MRKEICLAAFLPLLLLASFVIAKKANADYYIAINTGGANPSQTSAVLSGYITYGANILAGSEPSICLSNSSSIPFIAGSGPLCLQRCYPSSALYPGGGSFSCTVTGLNPGTTYYYAAWVGFAFFDPVLDRGSISSIIGSTLSFTTTTPSSPCSGSIPSGSTACSGDGTTTSGTFWHNVGTSSSSCSSSECEFYTLPKPSCSLSFSASGVTVGNSITSNWSSSNATSLSYFCSGPVLGSGALSPLSGSGTQTPTSPGTESCTVTATGPGGTGTCSDSYNVTCPSGTSWNGSSCQPISTSCGGNVPGGSTACSGDSTTTSGASWQYVGTTPVSCRSNVDCEYYTPVPVVNASCGSNARTDYPYTTNSYPVSGTFCGPGRFTGTPSFPALGSWTSWTCNGSGGGSNVTCWAYRNSAPAPSNNAPTASITAPSSDQNITTGQSINFAGTGTDSDGSIAGYQWRLSSCLGTLLSSSSSFTQTFNTAGTYTIYLTVMDDDGAYSTNCPSRNITVTNPITHSCTSSTPFHASAYDAEESTGLSVDTPWTYSASDTVAKCQFRCDSSYIYNSSTGTCDCSSVSYFCLPNPPTCAPTDCGTITGTSSCYRSDCSGTAGPVTESLCNGGSGCTEPTANCPCPSATSASPWKEVRP